MAWLKMDHATPEKPEVLAITGRMGWADTDLTVGKLFKLWRWFDQHTTDGNARGVTSALLDSAIGVTGLCAAVSAVGWMTETEAGVSLTDFAKHNGQTAKDRANTAIRVAKHKGSRSGNAQGNGASVSGALPREREREREEEQQDPPAARVPRATRKCPASFSLDADLLAFAAAEAPGINVEREFDKFRDHTFKNANSDWAATFRNWMRNASDRAKPAGNSFLAQKQAEGAKWFKGTSFDRSNIIDMENPDAAQLAIR